jgi:hypothetical protein
MSLPTPLLEEDEEEPLVVTVPFVPPEAAFPETPLLVVVDVAPPVDVDPFTDDDPLAPANKCTYVNIRIERHSTQRSHRHNVPTVVYAQRVSDLVPAHLPDAAPFVTTVAPSFRCLSASRPSSRNTLKAYFSFRRRVKVPNEEAKGGCRFVLFCNKQCD